MHDLARRFALILVVGCGLLSFAVLPWGGIFFASDPIGFAGWGLLPTQHWYFMLAILAAGLVTSGFVPAVRPAAIGGAILSKLAFIALAVADGLEAGPSASVWLEAAMLVALLAAAVVLAREAWQEARWDGVHLLRPEAW